MFCEECGNKLPDGAERCDKCGTLQKQEEKMSRGNRGGGKKKVVIGIAAVLVVVLGCVFINTVCIHKWTKATCTESEVCSKCGKVRSAALGHDWREASCTTPQTCERCGITEGDALGHTMERTVCMKPMICSVCGEKMKEKTEHIWNTANCTEPKTCSICGYIKGKALGHDWKEVSCITPKYCRRCKYVEGKALGHEWLEVNCTTPKTCDRCHYTEGKALGHEWLDATYDDPMLCSRCGEKEGKALKYALLDSLEGTWRVDAEFIQYLRQEGIVSGIDDDVQEFVRSWSFKWDISLFWVGDRWKLYINHPYVRVNVNPYLEINYVGKQVDSTKKKNYIVFRDTENDHETMFSFEVIGDKLELETMNEPLEWGDMWHKHIMSTWRGSREKSSE